MPLCMCTKRQANCVTIGVKGDSDYAIDVRLVSVIATVQHGVQDGRRFRNSLMSTGL